MTLTALRWMLTGDSASKETITKANDPGRGLEGDSTVSL